MLMSINICYTCIQKIIRKNIKGYGNIINSLNVGKYFKKCIKQFSSIFFKEKKYNNNNNKI